MAAVCRAQNYFPYYKARSAHPSDAMPNNFPFCQTGSLAVALLFGRVAFLSGNMFFFAEVYAVPAQQIRSVLQNKVEPLKQVPLMAGENMVGRELSGGVCEQIIPPPLV